MTKLTLYDVDRNPHSQRGALELNAKLSHAAAIDPMAPLASGSYLAHLHFKVAALEPALERFEMLGFERHQTLDSWGFADMGAGQPSTNRMAMKIWTGPNGPPAPETMAGLRYHELISYCENAPRSPHLSASGEALHGIDLAGVPVTLLSSS